MSEYTRQHYVPNGVLKNFGNKKSNRKYSTCLFDLQNSKVEFRNTDGAMCSKNLYDTKNDDIKDLEKKLNINVEGPFFKILNRILNNLSEIDVTRRELEIIRKYMLAQIFRSEANKEGYANPPEDKILLSAYNIKDGETPTDFWKRELMTIMDNDWDSLVESADLISVKLHAQELHTGFLIFFKTQEEFVINDRGYVCERFPLTVPEESIEPIKVMLKTALGIDDPDALDKMIRDPEQYVDTAIWMPLSANLAVVNANCLFTYYIYNPWSVFNLPMPLQHSKLFGYLGFPEKTLINKKLIRAEREKILKEGEAEIKKMSFEERLFFKNRLESSLITKHKDDGDMYKYKVHELGKNQTMGWNHLVMNEAGKYLCVKTPSKLIPTIEEYNEMKSEKVDGIKRDYNGYEELIRSLIGGH